MSALHEKIGLMITIRYKDLYFWELDIEIERANVILEERSWIDQEGKSVFLFLTNFAQAKWSA